MIRAIRPAPPEVREALHAALVDAGCPIALAATVAGQATCEEDDDGDYVCLLGNCVGIDVDDDGWAFDSLVENVVADNAEAHDRLARGEAGYEPIWPLPDRVARRRR